MVGIPDPAPNVGFMLARHLACRLGDDGADNGAEGVVMAAQLARGLVRLSTDQGRADVRDRLAVLVACAVAEVEALSEPLTDATAPTVLASVVHDDRVRQLLLQARAQLGPAVPVVVREARADRSSVEYVEGSSWETTALSDVGGELRFAIDRPVILIWNASLDDPRGFAEAVGRVAPDRHLLVLAREANAGVRAVAHLNGRERRRIVVLRLPGEGPTRLSSLADLSALTGAPVLGPEGGDRLEHVGSDRAGEVRRATITRTGLTLLAGDAMYRRCVKRAAEIEVARDREADHAARQELQLRIGRLRGGLGIVWVGTFTESARDDLVVQARRGVERLRQASASGLAPGGYAGYLAAANRIGYRLHGPNADPLVEALGSALVAPIRWYARGVQARVGREALVKAAWEAAPQAGLDDWGEIVDLRTRGLVEPAGQLIGAILRGRIARRPRRHGVGGGSGSGRFTDARGRSPVTLTLDTWLQRGAIGAESIRSIVAPRPDTVVVLTGTAAHVTRDLGLELHDHRARGRGPDVDRPGRGRRR